MPSSTSPPVRTRFAPSPTGYAHIGNIRTALFSWALARHQGGQFILRIEDTDKKREVEGGISIIYESFRLLGIDIDEGPENGGPHAPYIQSQRLPLYQQYAKELVTLGVAYYCFCSAKRLEEMRADQKRRGIFPPRYDRHCLTLTPEEVQVKLGRGEAYVIRLRMPDNELITWEDGVMGKLQFNSKDVDDSVLLKSDGFPTYHLAAIVDDHLMGITHALRATEWISSTPKHLVIYRALGWSPPQYSHVPNVMRPDGRKKLGKRDGAKSVKDYLAEGYLPEAILNFTILIGWHPSDDVEIMTREEIINKFSLQGVKKSPGIFDGKKLDFLNGHYIRQLSDSQLAHQLQPFLPTLQAKAILHLAPLLKERLIKLADATALCSYLWEEPKPSAESLLQRGATPSLVVKMLTKTQELIMAHPDLDPLVLQEVLLQAIKNENWNTGQFFMVLRMAIAGQPITPPLLETFPLLGQKTLLVRLTKALSVFAST